MRKQTQDEPSKLKAEDKQNTIKHIERATRIERNKVFILDSTKLQKEDEEEEE